MNLHVVMSLLTLNLIFEFKIFFYAEYTRTIGLMFAIELTEQNQLTLFYCLYCQLSKKANDILPR